MTGVESGEPGAGSGRGPAVIAVVFTALVLAVGVGWWNWPKKTPPDPGRPGRGAYKRH